MSKTLNEMVHAIVDYCGSITRAAEEAKRQKAAVLPIMDQLYKEFRG